MVDEPIEQPLLGVVGADLDGVDDVFVLETHDLPVLAGLGEGEVGRQRLASGDQRLDLILELAEAGDRTLLGDLDPVGGA